MSINVTVGQTPNSLNVNGGFYAAHAQTHTSGNSDQLDHNLLSGLQGGSEGQRYHLTLEQYNLIGGDAGFVSLTGNQDISGVKSFENNINALQNLNVNGTITANQLDATGTISIKAQSIRIYDDNLYGQINPNPLMTTSLSYTLPPSAGILTTNNTAVMLVGSQTIAGEKTFNNQIRINNQQLTEDESVVTRENGDARYGAYSDISDQDIEVIGTDFVTIVSIILPVGLYQFDAFVASQHNSSAGCKIRFGTLAGGVTTDIKVGLNDSYSRPLVAGPLYPLISSAYDNTHPLAIRSDIGTNEYRRSLTGIVEILTEGTRLSIDYAQQTIYALQASKARARTHIIARKIN